MLRSASRVISIPIVVNSSKAVVKTMKSTPKFARASHTEGCKQFFTDTTAITAFDEKVYDACMRIPKGKVSTYKSLARVIGSPKAVRAVGSSLKRNPFAPLVPCHRVVASSFALGGFQGSTDMCGGNLKRKVEMLEEEGVKLKNHDKSSKTVATVKVSTECFYDFE